MNNVSKVIIKCKCTGKYCKVNILDVTIHGRQSSESLCLILPFVISLFFVVAEKFDRFIHGILQRELSLQILLSWMPVLNQSDCIFSFHKVYSLVLHWL